MPGPIVSAIASLIIPGLGQLLNKKFLRGGGLIALWLVSSAVVSVIALTAYIFVHLLFMLVTAIDAFRVAKSVI